MSAKKQRKPKKAVGLAAVILSLAIICGAVCWLLTDPGPGPGSGTQPPETQAETVTGPAAAETKPVQLDEIETVSINLGAGMRITDVGRYTGIYMEDGSDELVSGVMMIAVTNEGEHAIQYAEISLPVGDETAEFTLSTLPAGSTVILLEQSRMAYKPAEYTSAVAENVVLFTQPLDLCEDRLKIQVLDGAINVSNLTDRDIPGDITIYYKNSAADVYYGGITYRVRIEGGIRAGELKQIMAGHFSESGSSILFVTCGEG